MSPLRRLRPKNKFFPYGTKRLSRRHIVLKQFRRNPFAGAVERESASEKGLNCA
jgi:hypothetical protein